MSTDAIVLLKQDHQEVRKLFREFEKAGENATVAKGKLVSKIIELLTVHTYIENEVMYPRVRELLPELEDDAFVQAHQRNFETIHAHDVIAERTGLLGELRRELAGGDGGAHASLDDWLRTP